MSDEETIEVPVDDLLHHGGKVIHMAECARNMWKAGNPSASLIYFDRMDNELGRMFAKLGRGNPDLAARLLDAAANANEGK